MKCLVEIGFLTKYDAFRVNRDQVVDLEIWFSNSLIINQVKTKKVTTVIQEV